MTNKKQVSLAVLAVVFATAMIVSVIASDSAFAKSKRIHQSITQANSFDQKSNVQSAGAGSSITNSGNNVAVGINFNAGGNAASQ